MRKILLIDDEQDILESLSELLSEHFIVSIATDTTYNSYDLSTYDLIISDFSMPSTNGIEIFEKHKEKIKGKFIIFSGSITQKMTQLQIGIIFVEKPHLNDLFKQINIIFSNT